MGPVTIPSELGIRGGGGLAERDDGRSSVISVAFSAANRANTSAFGPVTTARRSGRSAPAIVITGMVIAVSALALAVATRRLQPPADEGVEPSPTDPVPAETEERSAS